MNHTEKSVADESSWASDDALAAEIELYGDMVVAASESDAAMTLPQIDRALGIPGENDTRE